MASPAFTIDRPATRLERMTGRLLAKCVHPVLAWRVSSTRARIAIVLAYALAGYGIALTALLVAGRSMPSL